MRQLLPQFFAMDNLSARTLHGLDWAKQLRFPMRRNRHRSLKKLCLWRRSVRLHYIWLGFALVFYRLPMHSRQSPGILSISFFISLLVFHLIVREQHSVGLSLGRSLALTGGFVLSNWQIECDSHLNGPTSESNQKWTNQWTEKLAAGRAACFYIEPFVTWNHDRQCLLFSPAHISPPAVIVLLKCVLSNLRVKSKSKAGQLSCSSLALFYLNFMLPSTWPYARGHGERWHSIVETQPLAVIIFSSTIP